MIVKRNGCEARIFRTESNGWCIKIGGNIYAGFSTRKAAAAAVANYI